MTACRAPVRTPPTRKTPAWPPAAVRLLPPRPRRAEWRPRWHPLAWAGLGIMGLLAVFALLAPLFLPDPATQHYDAVLAGPSWAHPLGADALGRDLLARLAQGLGITLLVAGGSQALAFPLGLAVGGAAAVRGGWVDALCMRVTDGVFALPSLLLLILVRATVGSGILPLTLALGLTTWPLYARLARGQVLALLDAEYVTAARALGAGEGRILRKHLWPNARGPLLAAMALALPGAAFLEAALGYLGLSVAPPAASVGTLVAQGYAVVYVRPLALAAPVLAIALLGLGATLLAEGWRLGPRRRRTAALRRLDAGRAPAAVADASPHRAA